MSTLLPALLGFFAGVLGATFTPIIQWNIEKRRLKLQYKRDLIAQWRKAIAEAAAAISPDAPFEEVLTYMVRNPAFYSLIVHRDPNTILRLQATHSELIKQASVHLAIAAFMEDINRMEREWGLI
jgi:hypothetical protein